MDMEAMKRRLAALEHELIVHEANLYRLQGAIAIAREFVTEGQRGPDEGADEKGAGAPSQVPTPEASRNP